MQFVRRVPYAAARLCQEGYPRWSPKRQFSPAVGKVTGGGKAALRDGVHSPLSLIRNIRSMETGTLVLNAGMVISLIGMSSSDMIFLRSMSILGGCCGMYYNFTRKPPLRPPIIWGLVFLTLHCGKVVQLLFEKRPIAFDTDELDLYERHFQSMPARKFHKFCSHAQTLEYYPGDIICNENEEMSSVKFLLNGRVDIMVANQRVASVSAEKGTYAPVLGEISFLEKLKQLSFSSTPPADKHDSLVASSFLSSATVVVSSVGVGDDGSTGADSTSDGVVRLLSISQNDLYAIMEEDMEFKSIFLSVLTDAVVHKLIESQEERLSSSWGGMLYDFLAYTGISLSRGLSRSLSRSKYGQSTETMVDLDQPHDPQQ